jgi:hypothetical protein
MKITAHGSGGFAGLSEHYQVDTATARNGACIEALLASLDYLPQPAPCPAGADIGRWQITLDNGRQQHTVAFAEDGSAAAEPWQSLLAQLRSGS